MILLAQRRDSHIHQLLHRTTLRTAAQALHQLLDKDLLSPKLSTSQVVHIAMRLSILTHSLALARASTTHDTQRQAIALCLPKQEAHLAVSFRRGYLPSALRRGSQLISQVAPHRVCYIVPRTAQHLVDRRRAHAIQAVRCLLLTPFEPYVTLQALHHSSLFIFIHTHIYLSVCIYRSRF